MKQSIKSLLLNLKDVLHVILLLIWLPIALTGTILQTLWEVLIDRVFKNR